MAQTPATTARPFSPKSEPSTAKPGFSVRSLKNVKPIWLFAGAGVAAVAGLVMLTCLTSVVVVAFRKPATTPSPVVVTTDKDNKDSTANDKLLTPEEIFQRHSKSVAVIKSSKSSGSGFVVAPNLIATNAHVVRSVPVDRLQVYFPTTDPEGKSPMKVDMVVHYDRQCDLALLRVSTSVPPLTVVADHEFKPGQSATAIGSPGFGNGILENAITSGVMSTKHKEDGLVRYQMNMAVNPGNSGGPVFDNHGRVIGVVVSKATKQEAVSFAVTCQDLSTAVSKATKLTDQEARKVSAEFDLEVSFRGVVTVGDVYTSVLKVYNDRVSAWAANKSDNRAPAQVLREARATIDQNVKNNGYVSLEYLNQRLLEDVKPTLQRMARSPFVDKKTYELVMDLWNNYQDLKGYADSPRVGDPTEFKGWIDAQRDSLAKRNKLIEELKIRIGVTDLD